MYYPQQSPGIAHKLSHPDNPWSRPHVNQNQSAVGPPLQSPSYPLYTNGNVHNLHHNPSHHPLAHPTIHHHHQSSLSHYPSPPNAHSHQQHPFQGSPVGVGTQVITQHWQQQLLKCEMVRSSRSPHHRARANAMASRTIAKSAIPITNPNLIKPSPESKDADANESSSEAENTESPLANHPSSTVGPVAEAPRPTAAKPLNNTWSSLDMGGMNIKNIPHTSGLFSFTFLLNLYLNHNALTSVPPEIRKLRHLELLDLSGNNLTTLTPEIGMLTSLKELYLFDNHIQTIPPEFGTLHQLRTLGIEGNPIEPSLKALVQKDGTSALIAHLRDTCPGPSPPPKRLWKSKLKPPEREALESDPTAETFSLLSFNILCEKAATERMYGYTPSWALQWDYRKQLILEEIVSHDADFVCLQEVDIAQFEGYFTTNLGERGYEGVYWPKSRYKTMNDTERRLVDGCAIFYKSERYQLVEKVLIEYHTSAMQRQDFKKTNDMFDRMLNKDHIAVICLIEDRFTGTRLVISNTHLHWDPNFCDVKLVQTALLVDEIQRILDRFAKLSPKPPPPPPPPPAEGEEEQPAPRPPPIYTDGSKIPVIVCGDFNSVEESGVYQFLANGHLPANHPDFLSHVYGRYTSDGLRHRLALKNAYDKSDLSTTNFTSNFNGVIDYVWFGAANLAVNAVLGDIDPAYLEKVVGFPNVHFPSDHVCIGAEFRVKPPREAPPRPPPPIFS